MGVRSDVAFCVKNEVYQKLSDGVKNTIKEYFGDYQDRSEEGIFFYTEDVKWYHDSYGDLICLYNELHEQDADGFLIIQCCSEYPTDNDGDLGSWYESPWEIYKEVSVSLNWNRPYTGQPNV